MQLNSYVFTILAGLEHHAVSKRGRASPRAAGSLYIHSLACGPYWSGSSSTSYLGHAVREWGGSCATLALREAHAAEPGEGRRAHGPELGDELEPQAQALDEGRGRGEHARGSPGGLPAPTGDPSTRQWGTPGGPAHAHCLKQTERREPCVVRRH
jgi:hypothetical protein